MVMKILRSAWYENNKYGRPFDSERTKRTSEQLYVAIDFICKFGYKFFGKSDFSD